MFEHYWLYPTTDGCILYCSNSFPFISLASLLSGQKKRSSPSPAKQEDINPKEKQYPTLASLRLKDNKSLPKIYSINKDDMITIMQTLTSCGNSTVRNSELSHVCLVFLFIF